MTTPLPSQMSCAIKKQIHPAQKGNSERGKFWYFINSHHPFQDIEGIVQ